MKLNYQLRGSAKSVPTDKFHRKRIKNMMNVINYNVCNLNGEAVDIDKADLSNFNFRISTYSDLYFNRPLAVCDKGAFRQWLNEECFQKK
jgi:hypothetical protein